MGNLPDIFKDFSGLINKIQGLSKTAKKIQDFSRMWQPCGTLARKMTSYGFISPKTLLRIRVRAGVSVNTFSVKHVFEKV